MTIFLWKLAYYEELLFMKIYINQSKENSTMIYDNPINIYQSIKFALNFFIKITILILQE